MALRASGVNVAEIARHNCPRSHPPLLSHEGKYAEMNPASNSDGGRHVIGRISDIAAVNRPHCQRVLFSAFLRIRRI